MCKPKNKKICTKKKRKLIAIENYDAKTTKPVAKYLVERINKAGKLDEKLECFLSHKLTEYIIILVDCVWRAK